MSLNVKNSAAEDAVRQLIAATGESQARAIEVAARERLERLRASGSSPARKALITSIQQRVRSSGAALSTDQLYDEQGLPR